MQMPTASRATESTERNRENRSGAGPSFQAVSRKGETTASPIGFCLGIRTSIRISSQACGVNIGSPRRTEDFNWPSSCPTLAWIEPVSTKAQTQRVGDRFHNPNNEIYQKDRNRNTFWRQLSENAGQGFS